MELNSFRKEITPTRLLSFLNLVNYKSLKKEDLINYIYPGAKKGKSSLADFSKYYNFSLEHGFIEEGDFNTIAINSKKFSFNNNEICEESFKDLMREILFLNKDSKLYKINNFLFSYRNNKIYFEKFDNISQTVSDVVRVTEEDVRAYRFWSKYLGYTIQISDDFLMLNPYDYISRLNKDFNSGETIIFKDYLNWLIDKDVLFANLTKDNLILTPFSLALTILNDMGLVKLIYQNDAREKWTLENMELRDVSIVSHIEVISNE